MSAAATSTDQPKPSRAGRLLNLVRKLIDYGRELAATLHQRNATDLRSVARSFGTGDLALILLRIRRGLLRASALETRLVQCAPRLDAEPEPRAAPAQRQPGPARAAAPAENPDAPIELPTEAEIAAWIRRRPIGTVIADICRDLGITGGHKLWREIHWAITYHGGGYVRLVGDIIDRTGRLIAQSQPAGAPPTAPAAAGTGPP